MSLTLLGMMLCFQFPLPDRTSPQAELLPMPKEKDWFFAVLVSGQEEYEKPKGKPKSNPKDWIKFSGIGVIKGKEIVVGQVAYEAAFPGKVPGEGRLIAFNGTFDGHILQCQSWSRPVEGRKPFIDFTAEGVVKLIAPGKDQFLVHGLSWLLPFVSDEIQDAAEAGTRVRVSGGLEWSESSYSYRVTRMEIAK